MKKYLIALTIFLSLIVPVFSFAQDAQPVKLDYSGLVKCDGVVAKDINGNPLEKERQQVCDFNALMNMVKSTINWLFFITVPIVTVLMAYAGLLYMTGTSGNISTAKKIFPSVATGFIIMLVAWISVITVVNWFVTEKNKTVIGTFINTPSK
jgi:hypothetical protein